MSAWAIGVGAAAAAAVSVFAFGGRTARDPGPSHPGIMVVPGHGSTATIATALVPARPPATAAPATNAWRPRVGDTWQWQLTGKIDTGYDVRVYDVDLFETPDAVIAELHAAGRAVVCYLSAGSAERWRPDYAQFTEADKGKALEGWPGERWLDTRSANVRRIMQARLDLAATRGCEGVEPDNVEAYTARNGLGITADDQLDYNHFLARQARRRGLRVGLKNDLAQVKVLSPEFDFAVNEQCHQYRECDRLRPFTVAGKPVFNAEYQRKYRDNTNGARTTLCADARAADLRTLVLPLDLDDAYRISCD